MSSLRLYSSGSPILINSPPPVALTSYPKGSGASEKSKRGEGLGVRVRFYFRDFFLFEEDVFAVFFLAVAFAFLTAAGFTRV